jgi:hypothetical protein
MSFRSSIAGHRLRNIREAHAPHQGDSEHLHGRLLRPNSRQAALRHGQRLLHDPPGGPVLRTDRRGHPAQEYDQDPQDPFPESKLPFYPSIIRLVSVNLYEQNFSMGPCASLIRTLCDPLTPLCCNTHLYSVRCPLLCLSTTLATLPSPHRASSHRRSSRRLGRKQRLHGRTSPLTGTELRSLTCTLSLRSITK